ncbi:acyl-CoA dehydrogenase family protein [Micromonospora sp. NBC_01405]|uniref:acyl-CoA dehydrogenase family protein n=1 Tax=Micromonospora sp. NBC_01405 TaxID=2903589 RepID=UPI003255FCB0
MDLELSAEQEAVRQLAAEFVAREVTPHAATWDRHEAVDPGIVGKLGEVGFLGLTVAEEHGGSGGDHLSYCLVLEELGRGDSAVRGMVSVSLGLVAKSIAAHGTPAQRREIHGKLGLRGQATAELVLDGVRVPDSARLGETGGGFRLALATLAKGRMSVAAGCVGIAQGCLDAAVGYAGARTQFGKPIAGHQLVQQMLAEIAVDTAAARLLVWRVADLIDRGEPFATEASMAKLFASEAAVRAANNAVQVFGGYGYIDEYPVGKYLRDARVATLYEGTSQIQQLLIGRALTGVNAF